jgi:hypothetical protein
MQRKEYDFVSPGKEGIPKPTREGIQTNRLVSASFRYEGLTSPRILFP